MSDSENKTSTETGVQSVVHWRPSRPDEFGRVWQWDLVVRVNGTSRTAATVWRNNGSQATWHTWDHDGVGGENDVEHEDTPEKAIRRAKIEAAASAIEQGFV